MNSKAVSLKSLQAQLRRLASSQKKSILTRFFKSGPGEYGEGDQFLGVSVPDVRGLISQGRLLATKDLEQLLASRFHEERMLAILILVERFKSGNAVERKSIFNYYLWHRDAVNNWDLVDLSAHKIVGAYLEDKSKAVLFKLARSKRMWDRRIAVVSTWHLIRQGSLNITFELCAFFINDREDLMHKACGWMLREAGKKDVRELEVFLKKYGAKMPRTMLRYAIEKFPEPKRQNYLQVSRSVFA